MVPDGSRQVERGEGLGGLLEVVRFSGELLRRHAGRAPLGEVGDRRADIGPDLRRRAALDLPDRRQGALEVDLPGGDGLALLALGGRRLRRVPLLVDAFVGPPGDRQDQDAAHE